MIPCPNFEELSRRHRRGRGLGKVKFQSLGRVERPGATQEHLGPNPQEHESLPHFRRGSAEIVCRMSHAEGRSARDEEAAAVAGLEFRQVGAVGSGQ
jgi:hypothetical protein